MNDKTIADVETRKQLNVEVATNRLKESIDNLLNTCACLEHVLTPIVSTDTVLNEETCRDVGVSPLAEQILSSASTIDEVARRVLSLINRL